MILTKQFLKEKEACREGYEFACENLLGLEHEAVINKLIETGHVNWANWFITRMMDYKQRVQYAVFAAEQVLDIFEKKYPEDKRPRLAIEAAKKCIEDPSEENKQAARKARAADAAAAAAAAAADAAYAAYAAAAYAAADAAREKIRKQCADIVRKYYPVAPTL